MVCNAGTTNLITRKWDGRTIMTGHRLAFHPALVHERIPFFESLRIFACHDWQVPFDCTDYLGTDLGKNKFVAILSFQKVFLSTYLIACYGLAFLLSFSSYFISAFFDHSSLR